MTEIIFLDVDGTLTDGKIYYNSTGEELKNFNIKDGLIIASMVKMGYKFVIVTGRESSIVDRRMRELGIKMIFQGVSDKCSFIDSLIEHNSVMYGNCCYIGDDLNDYKSMSKCGIKGCPADACDEIKQVADLVSSNNAGDGAVREILEDILKKDNKWNEFIEIYGR